MNYQRYEKAILDLFKAQRKIREGGKYERHAGLSEFDTVPGCSCEKGWHYMYREHLGGLEHNARMNGLDPQVFRLVMEKRDTWKARTVLRPWFKKLNFFENLMGTITKKEAENQYVLWLSESGKKEPYGYPKYRSMS